MAEVFVSYARATEQRARAVADAVRALGYSVWRDDQLPAHRPFGEVIAERIAASRAVVVLWSADAARSHWVLAEADAARAAGTLVQARVDGTMPPMPFNQLECADLSGWTGGRDHPGWRKVADSLAALVGTRPGVAPAPDAPSAKARTRDRPSVCVLPFANMNGDAEQDHFSDGISEDIITDLSKASALSVVARNTAFSFRDDAVDVRELGQRLGVSHVLEGSVRRAGNRVRINAQLIDAVAGDHVWAERWDRDLHDIFAIQDEISQAVVSALCLKLLPGEKLAMTRRGTTSPDAFDLFLMARQLWTSGNEGSRARDEKVIALCRRALAIDEHYARAWALLAMAQAFLQSRHGVGEDGGEAAARALSLDPDLAEAHAVRAQALAAAGDHAGADEALAEALRLDRESWEVNNIAGRLAFRRGRIDEAIGRFERAAALVPTDVHSPGMLVVCYTAVGDRDAAVRNARVTVARAERVIAGDRGIAAALAHGAYSLACLGEADRAGEWTTRALLLDPDNMTMRYNLACARAAQLGDPEGALDLLAPIADRMGETLRRHMAGDPDMDGTRELPRYAAIVAGMVARQVSPVPAPGPAVG